MAVGIASQNASYTRSVGWGSLPNFSVSGWVYLATDRDDYSTFWSLDNGTGNNLVIQTNSDGTTLGIVSNGSWSSVSLSMSVGQWYWVGVVKNGSTATVYRSTGTGPITSTSHSVTNALTANTLRIGQSPWDGEFLSGRVAALKVWGDAHPSITEERDYTAPVRATSLRAWYPFEVAETTDHSGNGETLSGGSGATTQPGPGIPFSPSEDVVGAATGSAGGAGVAVGAGSPSDTIGTAAGSASGSGAAAGVVEVVAVATGSAGGSGAATGGTEGVVLGFAAGTAGGDGSALGVAETTATATGAGGGAGNAVGVLEILGIAVGTAGGAGAATGQGQSGQMAGLAGGSAGGAGAAIGVLEILGVATGSANGSGTAHGNRGETIARFVYVVPSESRVYRVRGET